MQETDEDEERRIKAFQDAITSGQLSKNGNAMEVDPPRGDVPPNVNPDKLELYD